MPRYAHRRDFALALARKMREDAERHGPPPRGMHTLMGPATKERLDNVMAALERGVIAPVQMIARLRRRRHRGERTQEHGERDFAGGGRVSNRTAAPLPGRFVEPECRTTSHVDPVAHRHSPT